MILGKIGRLLGIVIFLIGLLGTFISILLLIYVEVFSCYRLEIFNLKLENPDLELSISTMIFFLILNLGISFYEIFDNYS